MAGFLNEIEPLKQTALAELKAAQQSFGVFLCIGGTFWLSMQPTAAQNQELLIANNGPSNGSILRYSATGVLLGNFTVTEFARHPGGMAFDSDGNLYVTISGGTSAIYRYSSSGANLDVFATTALSTPLGLAFDSGGRLIVCNYGDGSINAYSPSGDLLWHVSTGVVNPAAIALDHSDNIYISNSNQGPGFGVFRFSPSGGQKTLFATGADLDARGLAFDSVGNLYVANQYDNTVRRFAPNGTPLGSFANTGLNLPFALAFDESGELFVSNQRGGGIRRFSPEGVDLGNFALVATMPANPVGLAFFPVPEPMPFPILMLGVGIIRLLPNRRHQ
jgi:sugar lactone lactonase YvrE